MIFDKRLLVHLIRDALRQYSADFHIENISNPITFGLNEQKYSVHVSYLHETIYSGTARHNVNEIRVQLTRTMLDIQRSRFKNHAIAFLGFFPFGKTFIAWDPRHVLALKATTAASVYARLSQETDAVNNLVSAHKFDSRYLQTPSLALAFLSSTLGFYLENISRFHSIPNAESIREFIAVNHHILSRELFGKSGSELTLTHAAGREKFVLKRKSYPRDPKFREQVLAAYKNSCCICNRQLAIVQAAHIIPNNLPESTNSVNNGLALCIEHHKLYDDGLLLPGPGKRLVFNGNRAEYLRQICQSRGLNEIESYHKKVYTIPKQPHEQPLHEYLEKGLRIRMA